ncbi:MAG: hypothetical protein GF315_10760 [candidate division Zixibacteria bacterium]|nr:hypothetical protein [candidate division Zixibacteria bacterium]
MKILKLLKRESGITMLEIMITVVLIGILSSMATPRFLQFIGRMKGRADVSNNISYLRSARTFAISNGVPTGVYFDIGNNQVYVFQDDNGDENYSDGTDTVVIGPEELNGSTNINYCSFENNVVIFETDGSTDESGTIEFGTCDDSYRQYTVSILAATGKVSMTIQNY